MISSRTASRTPIATHFRTGPRPDSDRIPRKNDDGADASEQGQRHPRRKLVEAEGDGGEKSSSCELRVASYECEL